MALYCFTTIRVAAGAVAAAMEPKVIADARDSTWGNSRCTPTRATSTRAVVITAWAMPTVMACWPMLRRELSRNSLPMTKAIKPSATWVTTP